MKSTKKINSHTLTLCVRETEMLVMKITKQQYESYLAEGLPYDIYEELDQYTEVSGPIYDDSTRLMIDESEVENFNQLFKSKYKATQKLFDENNPVKTHKTKSNLEYAVLVERSISQSYYSLKINEEFNFSKLGIEIARDNFFGSSKYLETFYLSFAGNEFVFNENFGPDYEGIYLKTSSGESHNINIRDLEDENLESEVYVEAIAKRLYIFQDKKTFDNFNNWIESDLKPRIDDGLDNITEIKLSEKSKNHYEILIIGNDTDISCLPDADTEWVKKEIGNFSIQNLID
jgi:hypothetical protein